MARKMIAIEDYKRLRPTKYHWRLYQAMKHYAEVTQMVIITAKQLSNELEKIVDDENNKNREL